VPSPQLEKFLANFSEPMMDEHDSLETVRAKMARLHPNDHAPALVYRLWDLERLQPACLAGLTPWLDARQSGEAARNLQGVYPFVNGPWSRARFRDCAGAADLDDAALSPLHADLTGLPPIYLGVGTIDAVRDDAMRFTSRAAQAGLQVLLDVVADHVHGLHGLVGMCPESDRTMERVGEFVRTYIP
jgi:acetyl esterase/lipase